MGLHALLSKPTDALIRQRIEEIAAMRIYYGYRRIRLWEFQSNLVDIAVPLEGFKLTRATNALFGSREPSSRQFAQGLVSCAQSPIRQHRLVWIPGDTQLLAEETTVGVVDENQGVLHVGSDLRQELGDDAEDTDTQEQHAGDPGQEHVVSGQPAQASALHRAGKEGER
jgi:hypothetical protein